jgi:hypothetical protein
MVIKLKVSLKRLLIPSRALNLSDDRWRLSYWRPAIPKSGGKPFALNIAEIIMAQAFSLPHGKQRQQGPQYFLIPIRQRIHACPDYDFRVIFCKFLNLLSISVAG